MRGVKEISWSFSDLFAEFANLVGDEVIPSFSERLMIGGACGPNRAELLIRLQVQGDDENEDPEVLVEVPFTGSIVELIEASIPMLFTVAHDDPGCVEEKISLEFCEAAAVYFGTRHMDLTVPWITAVMRYVERMKQAALEAQAAAVASEDGDGGSPEPELTSSVGDAG
jgi:hypothetical protein